MKRIIFDILFILLYAGIGISIEKSGFNVKPAYFAFYGFLSCCLYYELTDKFFQKNIHEKGKCQRKKSLKEKGS